MNVARSPEELPPVGRAVALGTFDGVHVGHRRVIEAALAADLAPTVVTFHPHPRLALGNRVELITSLERRLELLAEIGIPDTLLVEFTPDVARIEPEQFVEWVLRPIGTRVVVAGENFRFGQGARGDLDLLARLGFDVRPVPLAAGVSSSTVRQLLGGGDVEAAAHVLGRPAEVDGVVVAGDARGGTLGFPTANLAVDPLLLVPAHGIYAGYAGGHRTAVSIGTNPHYGGHERRVEAHLIDFEGDLYGQRLIVELWSRLRDELSFADEAALVEQIARDVERTRRSARPV